MVLQEILKWSLDRPTWQRDALRRLVVNGDLSSDDLQELVEICKATHGLTDSSALSPLASEHVPTKRVALTPVSLLSIFHQRGVNALAENQTLKFESQLTVVYGDNATGKTGYIRILKSACRARGQEAILGNVVSTTTPLTPVVAIKYTVENEQLPREWTGQEEDEYISRVSIFDAQCAAVYLTEKTDVAFRPFGLDLFDKLVKACKFIRSQLEKEQRALASNALVSVQALIPEGTAVAKLLTNINSLTKTETVRKLSRLTAEEETRLKFLEGTLLDLQNGSPEQQVRYLSAQGERVRALAQHIRNVEGILSAEAVDAVLAARADVRRKTKEAKALRDTTFPEEVLIGTGTDSWNALWEAARQFSEKQAYPGKTFPILKGTVRCVLCQQNLGHEARSVFQRFETFVRSTTEQELQQARDTYKQFHDNFAELNTTTDSVEETLEELRIEHEAMSETITAALKAAEKRRKYILLALAKDRDLEDAYSPPASVADIIDTHSKQITERVETLQTATTDGTCKQLYADAQELRARKLLAQHKQIVLDEIERKRRFAAYGLCIDDTRTRAITQKSATITRKTVTQKLKASFQTELSRLDFHHVEVELSEAGGTEGVLYHKLVLTRAPGVELPKVVSEGEQRCLSIAAFFAELSMANDPSGIVFDDPVSSLDYRWREGVAHRLVQEAKRRQVIVFTHDIVFLLLLKQFAREESVLQFDQHVRQLSNGSGVCAEELPWVALKVSKRIGHLKNLLQDAEKIHHEGHQAAYEENARRIYGYLREAWERGLEEVLLGGVVERYRPNVQTQQVALIADITPEDCRIVEKAMTKCSKWLRGHDQAPAAQAEVPDPASLGADVEKLEEWVTAIRTRRRTSTTLTSS